MTWFRVDDQLPDHRKVRRAGTASMGLWLLTGAWSAGHLTDGWVPREVALRYGTQRQAERLVEAGLWMVEIRDDEQGWCFHQWTEHQPTRDQVQERRKKTAARVSSWRAATKKGGSIDPNSTDVPQEFRENAADDLTPNLDIDAGEDGLSRCYNGVSNGVSNAAPDPTRPVKKTDSLRSSAGARKRGTRIPDDFDATPQMIEWARQNTPSVGKAETDQFREYWQSESGAKAAKLDWAKAWQVWMRREQKTAEHRGGSRPSAVGGSPRVDKAAGYLHPDDPFLRQLTDPPPKLQIIEGGQSA
jgi:hypothetical protein